MLARAKGRPKRNLLSVAEGMLDEFKECNLDSTAFFGSGFGNQKRSLQRLVDDIKKTLASESSEDPHVTDESNELTICLKQLQSIMVSCFQVKKSPIGTQEFAKMMHEQLAFLQLPPQSPDPSPLRAHRFA